MMLSCPGCNTHYSLDERKLPARGARLTCRECGRKFKVKLPGSAAGAAAAAPPPPSAPPAPSARAGRPELSDSSGSAAKPVSCPKCGHFFIPFEQTGADPATKSPAGGPGASAAGNRGSVLLVEDQEYFAELTKDALGEGFRTTVVSTVSEARELLSHESFSLVILDLSLEEGQDGAQVLHLTSTMGIPVLIFTSRDETDLYGDTWEALKAAGATDILIKGMNVEEDLKKKVDDLLRPRD